MAAFSRDWEVIAGREPYFAVLTDAQYLTKNRTPRIEAEWFGTGEALIEHLLDATRRFDPDFTFRFALEFGCGPGRLAIPLAKRAEHVTAVDVSPAMLELAHRNAERFGASNIHFVTFEEFLAAREQFDLAIVHNVLQHLPAEEGMALFPRVLSKIRAGGIALLQIPFRQNTMSPVRVSRALREHVPGLNALTNLLRGKPRWLPLMQPHTYSLGDVFAAIRAHGYSEPYLLFEQQQDLDLVTIITKRTYSPELHAEPATPETLSAAPVLIDAKDVVAQSIAELNRRADEYFEQLTDWEHHLARPFARADETPEMLTNTAVLLQGLRLMPGLRVLDFGAGAGWLSRFLTQLGCEVVLLEVSPTALRMARELYERMPVVGQRPQPTFLPFDGMRIPLENASVDRIVCFDAFHHAPNPDTMLAEFARVLLPGGIAAFAEPGPHHSKTPQSQFEMRTYGVLESDVDVHALWRTAKRVGFDSLKLAVFHARPFHVSLDAYENLLRGGEPFARWGTASREFLQHVRVFFLQKIGGEGIDSRSQAGLDAALNIEVPELVHGDERVPVRATVTNIGSATWLPATVDPGGVFLGCHLYNEVGKLLQFDYHWESLGMEPLHPGESREAIFTMPLLPLGAYRLEFDCVARNVTWFSQLGSRTLARNVRVTNSN